MLIQLLDEHVDHPPLIVLDRIALGRLAYVTAFLHLLLGFMALTGVEVEKGQEGRGVEMRVGGENDSQEGEERTLDVEGEEEEVTSRLQRARVEEEERTGELVEEARQVEDEALLFDQVECVLERVEGWQDGWCAEDAEEKVEWGGESGEGFGDGSMGG